MHRLYVTFSGLCSELIEFDQLRSLSIAMLPYHGILYSRIYYMFVTYLLVTFVVSLLEFYIYCIQYKLNMLISSIQFCIYLMQFGEFGA